MGISISPNLIVKKTINGEECDCFQEPVGYDAEDYSHMTYGTFGAVCERLGIEDCFEDSCFACDIDRFIKAAEGRYRDPFISDRVEQFAAQLLRQAKAGKELGATHMSGA